jgi:hypothetical protein
MFSLFSLSHPEKRESLLTLALVSLYSQGESNVSFFTGQEQQERDNIASARNVSCTRSHQQSAILLALQWHIIDARVMSLVRNCQHFTKLLVLQW